MERNQILEWKLYKTYKYTEIIGKINQEVLSIMSNNLIDLINYLLKNKFFINKYK